MFGLVAAASMAGGPHACAADLSGLFAGAMSQVWPAGRTPVGAGTAAAGDPHVLTAAHVIAGCHHIGVGRAETVRPVTLVGLDSRLDLALLTDHVAGDITGSALAGAIDPGETDAPHGALHVVGFGQPGHATSAPVRVAVRSPGLVQGLAETSLLSLTGPLLAGTSGSPVLDDDNRSVGMVVGQVRAERSRDVAVRSVDLLRFLSYFGLTVARRPTGRLAAQAVLVQCVD